MRDRKEEFVQAQEILYAASPDLQNRLLLAALSDEKTRTRVLTQWRTERLPDFASRAAIRREALPPRGGDPMTGWRRFYLLTHPDEVRLALSDKRFSNEPYTELGGGGFMLGLDPTGAPDDPHGMQSQLAKALFSSYLDPALQTLAEQAAEMAIQPLLAQREFDVARYAEQAALRWIALFYGFPLKDHPLLERCAAAAYRGLQYVILGRHLVSEPATLPACHQALGQLQQRCASLIDDYLGYARRPRIIYSSNDPFEGRERLPDGCVPLDVFGLSGLGMPVLRRLAAWIESDSANLPAALSGQDLGTWVAGLIAGTVGNVQTSVVTAVYALLKKKQPISDIDIEQVLGARPPVAFLARHLSERIDLGGGRVLEAGRDCVLVMDALQEQPPQASCPHVFGSPRGQRSVHHCVGERLIRPLISALVRKVLGLPNLRRQLNAVNAKPIEPERLWGMGATSWPLLHDRQKRIVHQPLNAALRIRSPISQNADRLRQIISAGAPRIEAALKRSKQVHFAWFELLEAEGMLVLHTVYDGEFDAYLRFFIAEVGDLFDQLFECIEGGPRTPVVDYPDDFVSVIARCNRPPAVGYFFSAYPLKDVNKVGV